MSELYAAAKAGNELELKRLLEKDCSEVDYRTPHGKTPLYEACTEGHTRCVHLLLAAKASVDLAHSSGVTPLMSAVYHGHAMIVDVLVTSGHASLSLKDNQGKTALDVAKARGQVDCARLLYGGDNGAAAAPKAAAPAEPPPAPPLTEGEGVQGRAEALGLLTLMREVGADEPATLARAVGYFEAEGARSFDDIAKYGLADDFIETLQLQGRVTKAKLRDALRALGRKGEGLLARVGRLRAALSLEADPALLSLQAAVQAANEQLGQPAEGTLQTQVDALFAVLGLD